MPTKLRKLKITRVAVCDQGANPDADILLFKHIAAEDPGSEEPVTKQDLMGMDEDDDDMPPLDYATRQQQQDLWQELWEKWQLFCNTFYDLTQDSDPDDAVNLPILVSSIGQFGTDVESLLTSAGLMTKAAPFLETLASVSKVGAVMTAARKKRLTDAIAALQAILDEASPKASTEASSTTKGAAMAETLESVTKRLETAVAQLADVEKRATTAEARVKELDPQLATVEAELLATTTALAKAKQTPEEQEAEYEASLPEHVRKQRQAEKLEVADLKKRLQESDERGERTEYIQKTAAYRSLGITPDDWNVLKAIDTLPEDVSTRLTTLLKALTAQLKTSTLFKSVGVEGGQGAMQSNGSAEGELMALATAYQDKHNCDMPTAQNAVMKAHPDVYQRYVVEKRRNTRVTSE